VFGGNLLHRMMFGITNKRVLAGCIALGGIFWCCWAAATALSLPDIPPGEPLGKAATYMRETGSPLSLSQAMAAEAAHEFSPGTHSILTFGIGADPVWIHLAVSNPTGKVVARRLLIENSWIDHLDVYFVRDGQLIKSYRTGDRVPFGNRPLHGRFFAFRQDFAAGMTDIYLRVATPDPMVVPIFLLDRDEAVQREHIQGYSYGFVYGYLFALMAYNLMLYLSLRSRRNLLYAVFIAMFVAMNVAYTGHGFSLFWPNHTILQNWIIPVLMMLFGTSGLAFARHFLDTRANFPRTHRIVVWTNNLFLLLLLVTMLAGSQLYALLVSFAFSTFFSTTMLVLGAMSLYSGYKFARYFLLASIASMIGTTITTLSVWGIIPYADWKFRSVEMGMLIDATLLALALANQFRSIQMDHLRAEQRAARDPLTNLSNRRSFQEQALPIWSTSQRSGRNLSVIMLDLDHFKSVNDKFGHAVGDAALVATARALAEAAREGDIVARWGGEEFLFLLPETDIDAARALAERLQKTIRDIRIPVKSAEVALTASFGLAHCLPQENLESMIARADSCLYQSKQDGRDRISY
jgi:two-component system, sensor histidine kinase LadS